MAQPDDQAARAVHSLADMPEACARLTQLLVTTEHLVPKAVGRLVVDHARTLETLASVVEHRDRVPGTTAPALLGVVSEVRAHAAALVGVRAAAREWRSAVPGEPRPAEQMAQIRAQLDRDRRRLRRNPTDADLSAAVEALRPALQFAPALQQAVTRSVGSGAWRPLRAGDDGAQPNAALLAAVDRARDTAVHAVDALPASLRRARTDGRGTPVDLAEVRTADDVVVWLRSEQGRYLDAYARADEPVREAAFQKVAATLDALATVMDTGLSDRAAAGALTDLSRHYRIPAETQAAGTDPDYRLAITHLAHLVDRVAAQLTGVVNRRPHQAASAPTIGLHSGRDL